MAIRFDAVGDQLNRTANLPPNGSFTYMMWSMIDNELAAGTYQPYLWALDATSQQGYACGVINGIFDIECYNGGAVASSSSVASRPAAGQAACVYVRCSGTGANLINSGYRLAGQNVFTSSGNATLGSLNPMTQLYLGGLFGVYWMDGRRWNIKCWDRALSDAEILVESYFEKPQYPGSLNFYYPLYNVNDISDKSGNGRDPTTAGTLTTADSRVNMWRPKQRILRALAVAGTDPGRADEVDTALALLGSQARGIGLASETDLALALAGSQALAVGRSDETDSAFALTGAQSLGTGLATETDTALALTANTTGDVGLATETDEAFALAVLSGGSVGLAEETDTAFALSGSQALATGLAAETDTALALTGTQSLPVGIALETDTAFALVPSVPGGVGLAEETDTAFALTANTALGVGLATEADTALALLGSQMLSVLPADETDVAFSLSASTVLSVGLAVSFEQALALTGSQPSQVRNAWAINWGMVALCPIKYWNGSQWQSMEYKYWGGTEWELPPENQLP